MTSQTPEERPNIEDEGKIIDAAATDQWPRRFLSRGTELGLGDLSMMVGVVSEIIHHQLQKTREQRKGWKGYAVVDPKADNYKYSPVFSDRKGAELWVKGKEISGLKVVEVDILLVDHSELDQLSV